MRYFQTKSEMFLRRPCDRLEWEIILVKRPFRGATGSRQANYVWAANAGQTCCLILFPRCTILPRRLIPPGF